MKQRKIITVLLLMVLLIGVCGINAQAASAKWTKACKAYQTFLKKNVSKFQEGWSNPESYKKTSCFNIVDLDKNGVPELIAIHPDAWRQDAVYVYTYKNGKMKLVKGKNGATSIKCYYNANGSYTYYICKNKHFHAVWSGTDPMFHSIQNKAYYKIQSGKWVETKYKSAKCKKAKNMVGNTKSNRTKYLK